VLRLLAEVRREEEVCCKDELEILRFEFEK
jgi:hypothetical protein